MVLLGLRGGQELGRFQIEELSWEDREKVLRSLFAKINQTQQTYLSALPQHLLKLQTNRGATKDSLRGAVKSEGGYASLARGRPNPPGRHDVALQGRGGGQPAHHHTENSQPHTYIINIQ